MAEFELTEEAALPAELGAVTFLGETVADEQVFLGVGADCSSETTLDRIARGRFRLDLSEQTLPWAQALTFGIEVDGALFYGFGAGELDGLGAVTFEYQVTCPTGDQLTPGSHTLRFLGQVDATTIASSPVDFEHSCGGPDGEAAAGDGSAANDGNCSIGHRSGSTACRLVLPLLLLIALCRTRWRKYGKDRLDMALI